ncbi:hypothetical protein A2Y99_03765 [Candidatus Gottesmanbacteria bacterium RBG_13_37_7]|uniref:Membrane protein 6-pyruvoyl-tetrahydropterin synthase-related domain-containing protein n=1 Tax=Candidatus Gottesmanbacteria bacterium RBG_13_37_7 TaxID=1798369 RepID=A0A1F5YK41_9BACT|nr:MAG: hypothetical protein A2Y99_03765 [Candidatus Gottesmanbacteria bacterium RBG_13_37_7]
MKFRCSQRFILWVMAVLLALPVCLPLFNSQFFPMHDDTQPSRIFLLAQALLEGQFPVRMVSQLGYGYGYPLYNFYAPLPYYFGALFYLMGFSVISATKIMFMLGIIISAVSIFLLVSSVFDNYSALVSSMFYVYAPYHAVNIYVRGAVGEYFAYGFIPLLVYGLIKILRLDIHKPSQVRIGIISVAIGLSGTILSHNISGMITGYFLIIFLAILIFFRLIYKKNMKPIIFLIIGLVIGLGLASFFFLPAIIENGWTNVASLTKKGSDYKNHFVYLDQLWNSSWGFAGSAIGREDGMSFKIGKLHLLTALLAFGILLVKPKKTTGIGFKLVMTLSIVFFLSIFFMNDVSRYFWSIIPGFSFIQYPWRFLNLTIFSLSVTAGSFFNHLKNKKLLITSITLLFFLILGLNLKYFKPKELLLITDDYYIESENLKYRISKISDEFLSQNIPIPIKEAEVRQSLDNISSSKTSFVKEKDTAADKRYSVTVHNNGEEVATNIAYFPGWRVFLDGKKENFVIRDGFINLNLPIGFHILEFRFTDTPIRIISNTISFFALILLVYVSLFWKGYDICQEKKQ